MLLLGLDTTGSSATGRVLQRVELFAGTMAGGERMRLGCVVMACGEGTRFAAAGGTGNKLLASLAGEPLIVCTLAPVPAERFEVVVSTCWSEVADVVRHARPDAQVVCPEGERATRRASARAGLAAGMERWDGCLFVPGDQPLVSSASFFALADAFAEDPARAYRLAWAGVPASPVLFPASCFGAFWTVPGDDGGRAVLRATGTEVACVEARAPEELLDVDTPADLERIACHMRCDDGQNDHNRPR